MTRSCLAIRSLALFLTSVAGASGWASPLNSKLLGLVPAGAAIVAGFENRHDARSCGRLLLTTPNNRLDLDDWQALAGVDSKRIFDEVIEVAAASTGGDLTQHLLLVEGRFDRDSIFRAAEQNGAQRSEYQGEPVLQILPFLREQRVMKEARWLAILDNRTGILGTPELVQQALKQHANHAIPDRILVERLTQLRPDVSSWNLLESSPRSPGRTSVAPHFPLWAGLLADTDLFMVGARFGSKIRVDFSICARNDRAEEYFTQKAASFQEVFSPDAGQQAGSSQKPLQHRLENLSVERNRVRGSIELSGKEFDDWSMQAARLQIPLESLQQTMPTENSVAGR
jgi:hypothetical protein